MEVLVRIGLDLVEGRDVEVLMWAAVAALEKALVGWVVKGEKMRVAEEEEEEGEGVETGVRPVDDV